MKTHQVMDIQMDGFRYVCINDLTAQRNPYKLYKVWYEPGQYGLRKRKKKIVEYEDLDSVLFYVLQTKYPKASWDLTA